MRGLRFVYLVVGVFLIGCAGFAGYASSLSLRESLASRSWPSVQGRIISAKTRFITGRYGSSGPDIHYAYAVGGRPFTGTRVDVVTYSANTSYSRDALAEFQEGSEVPVYYDPARPERSALRTGPNWLAWCLPLFSALMVIFGIALVRLGVRLERG